MFLLAIDKSEKSSFVNQRIEYISEEFLKLIFNIISRSLFEKDKLLFMFMLCVQLLNQQGTLSYDEFLFLISVQVSSGSESTISFISHQAYARLLDFKSKLSSVVFIVDSILDHPEDWQESFTSDFMFDSNFPLQISSIQKLCLIRCIKPEQLQRSIIAFIEAEMGAMFTQFPPFDLEASFITADITIPLVFVLPGTDPMASLLKYAERYSKADTLQIVSLGKGRAPKAEKAIAEGRKRGYWVLLQNCHLCPSWMGDLEDTYEMLQTVKGKDNTHPSFRLWLSSYSSTVFPTIVLQNAVKITNEPPKDLKASLLNCYCTDPISDQKWFEGHPRATNFKALIFSLCTFHYVIQERGRFGSLGWNIQYQFTQSDLKISVRQLQEFLRKYESPAWEALSYLTGECNYGGRLTDDHDRRCIAALLNSFYNSEVLQPNYALSKNLVIPTNRSYWDYLEYISNLSSDIGVDILGFHQNAAISKRLKESDEICINILTLLGSTAVIQKQEDKSNIAQSLLSKLPKDFDIQLTQAKYPYSYQNCYNTYLIQELNRYNRLLGVLRETLRSLLQAMDGVVVMSRQLEAVCRSLELGLVPDSWKVISYPSLKSLASYFSDLLQRIQMLNKWIDDGPPPQFWLPGFYFTQGFMTSVLQNYARHYAIAIDTVSFDFSVVSSDLLTASEGAMTYGLFFECCQWDWNQNSLQEQAVEQLYTACPIIWFKPTQKLSPGGRYACPLYKTTERRGELTTTGHSTNFVIDILLETKQPACHWIKRGAALMCQLAD